MAQLGVKIGNVINAVIIGQLFGTDGLAVMSLVSPLELVMMSVGSLICVAGSIHAGFRVAKNDNDGAAEYYSASFWAVIILGVVLSVLGMIFARSLAMMFGADANIITGGGIDGDNPVSQLDTVTGYIRAMLVGGVFMAGVYLPLNFLKVIGKPNAAMNMLFIMSGVNIVGALLFTTVWGMGIPGVALGTALSYIAAFVYGQAAYHKADSGIKIKKPGGYIVKKAKALVSGVPSALNNVLRAVLALCVNMIILNILPGDSSVMLSAVAVLNSVMGIINAFVFGISQSTLQIAGIAYSERDFKTVKLAVKNIFIIGNIIVLCLSAIIIAGSSHIGALFGMADTSASTFACICAGCYANLYLCNNIFTNFFSATKRNLPAIVIVSLRLTLFMLVPALIICLLTGDGIGVWIGYFTAELFAIITIFIYTFIKRKNDPELSRFLLLDGKKLKGIKSENFSVVASEESAVFSSEKITEFLEETDLPPKKIMRVSMAVEEIVVLVKTHAKIDDSEYIDFRIFKNVNSETIFLRVRYGGRDFNPVKYSYKHYDDDDSDAFGMNMLLKLTDNVTYSRTLGVNNLLLEI
jgi:Na+-driven multidrug efflux pump/anti-sigma regulatory factor (Ser/Thr protein kinase)